MPSFGEVTITVVIAARNAERFLAECLESVAVQTSAPDEVIVVDDASTDATAPIAQQFAHRFPRFSLLRGPGRGISAARNLGNAAASSEVIAVLDADDRFARDALAHYRAAFRARPAPDLVYGDCETENARSGARRRLRYPDVTTASVPTRRLFAAPRLPFKHSSMAYRRATQAEIGGYREDFSIKVDVELFFRYFHLGKTVVKISHPISVHRLHPGQISRRRWPGLLAWQRIIQSFEPRAGLRLLFGALRLAVELGKSAVESFR